MCRLIDAEKLKQKAWDADTRCGYVQVVDVGDIDDAPIIEERKTGRWVSIDDGPCDLYECDQCGTTYDTICNTWDLPRFCPDCGAKMGE